MQAISRAHYDALLTAAIMMTMLVFDAKVAIAQEVLPLYQGAIQNAIDAPDEEALRDPQEHSAFLLNISRPTLTVYLPHVRDAAIAAVIILPGGSYRGVSIVKEGNEVAHAFNRLGIAAFVLKYRTPDDRHMKNRSSAPLQDVQQALRVVRIRAKEWRIDVSRIGLVGFSAGGHLAATAATHFNKPVVAETGGVSVRPDFLILAYPVISFDDSITHALSKANLLGESPSRQLIEEYSNELHVTAQTPPTFLLHAADDESVSVNNSLRFFAALHAHRVPVEMHVYDRGGHGFGLNNPTTFDYWFERCAAWLRSRKIISMPPQS